ncbi:hypothetical protein GCM10027596_25450 [Nocardioides korecus]
MALDSRRAYLPKMDENATDRILLELTPAEARLVVAALRQLEPFWPAGADDRTRAELLAEVRAAIDHVVGALPKSA